ncbi:cytochrome P450 family protein [Streptomyces chartreusis]|uniref:cytochrome P450 family protein n=1 Tax=Streptomyces chartreusis TaxID=1969 RepID=UPI00382FC0E7
MPPAKPIVLDLTGSHRHAEYQLLRAQGPAVRVDVLGVTAWAVTEPALLRKLLTSPQVSKNGRAHWPAFKDAVQTWPLTPWVATNSMFTAYDDQHRRLRRLIAPAFSSRRIAALKPTVKRVVAGLLDGLDEMQSGGIINLRESFACPLPMAIISHLMGVPASHSADFRPVVDGLFDTTLTAEQAAANTLKLYDALDRLIVAKRATPGEDMTSLLITARDDEGDGSSLSDLELRDTLLLMMTAGYETTVNVIDQAITALLSRPSQLAHVRAGRAQWSDVVEETLRHEPALKYLPMRFAVTDIPLPDGQIIKQGEAILASYAPANRDRIWHGPTADAFDVTRAVKDHLAFGHGVHFCLGAPLARLEAVTAVQALFDRFPAIELAVPAHELHPLPSLISNGHQALPVRLRPV